MFVITAVKRVSVGADVIQTQAKLTSRCTLLRLFYVALDARGPEEARLNSFVLSVELREPGNESIVHLQDEPGD